VENRVSS